MMIVVSVVLLSMVNETCFLVSEKSGTSEGIFAFLQVATASLNLNFSSSSVVIRLNLPQSQPSSFFFGLLSPLWYFSTLVNYYLVVSFNLKTILHIAKK